MENLTISLVDLLGSEYVDAVCRAAASLGLGDEKSLQALGREKVECWPSAYAEKVCNLLQKSGEHICEPFADDNTGAPTDAFGSHTNLNAAPLSGMGPYRLQEDGRLAIIGKSEHYQASLGQNFPGYRLLAIAQQIGITNVTHNNTRGFITRKLERELICTAKSHGLMEHSSTERPMLLRHSAMKWEAVSPTCCSTFAGDGMLRSVTVKVYTAIV